MIDAHHHIWRQKDLPWLLGPEQRCLFGAYDAIKRDYLIEEYLKDVKRSGVKKSAYVQANWAPNWFTDEAAWVQSIADLSGWPHAIIGYADFTVGDVCRQLDKLAEFPLVRGVRQQFHWHENPAYRFAKSDDLCTDRAVQKNIKQLSKYGWSFELQVFPSQMPDAAKLAAACPDVTFILRHAGMLEDKGKAGRAEWHQGMSLLAEQPNVVAKLSGFGTFSHRNALPFIAEMVRETVYLFGAGRCLFGSNFPIEKIWTLFTKLVAAFRVATDDLPEEDRQAIFNDTATRVYRI